VGVLVGGGGGGVGYKVSLSCGVALHRPQFFKSWKAPSTGQVSVQWIMQPGFPNLYWIVIYRMDSTIYLWNNRDRESSYLMGLND